MTQEDVDRKQNEKFLTAQRLKAEAEEAANKPAPAPAENLHAEEEKVTPPDPEIVPPQVTGPGASN